jgi:peptidoglycan/LPS O-acetylase OafA/YrhL
VSYGIYLFHLWVVPTAWILGRNVGVGVPLPVFGTPRFVIVTGVSIAAAALSWKFLERPINEQKHRFPYVRTDHTQPSNAIDSSVIPPSTMR